MLFYKIVNLTFNKYLVVALVEDKKVRIRHTRE